jgi:ParB-like chromosome segregation protein Spo0J
VTLDSIVGTVEARTDFDARFRPASNRIRRRWERIALAHRTGRALPPITLVRRPDGHYVIDGRHRVSVARALGHRDIEAWVRHAGSSR